MTSADPTIPNPYDLQSLNRASYVNNNPLGFTDPTGFIGEGTGTDTPTDRGTAQTFKSNAGHMWGLGTDVTQRAPLGAMGPSSAESVPQSAVAKTDGKTAAKGGGDPRLVELVSIPLRRGADESKLGLAEEYKQRIIEVEGRFLETVFIKH
jgi:hypothetical protein